MRVGIDGACWLNRRGYGRFARALLHRLIELDAGIEYTLVIDFDPAEAPPLPRRVRVVRVPTRRPAARAAAADGRRSLGDLWATSRAISRERFDLVFFPSAYTYVPVTGSAKIAVVIHDVIPERFPSEVFPDWRAAALWRLKLLAARHQADLIMTVSNASKQGISACFGVQEERIAVISEAADACFRPLPHDAAMRALPARWDLTGRRFLLYVGGISPHKNLGLLVDTLARLRGQQALADLRLVLAGDYAGDVFHSAYDALRQHAAARGVTDAIVFTGYADDQELVSLYNAAEALVLPSLLEGFGLPAIEAMACGAPVVASARGALPEVIGSAGLLFDPDSADDLATTLERLLASAELRADLQRRGPQRAATFSWERAAQETLAAFRGIVGRTAAPGRPAVQVADTTLAEKEVGG